MLTTTQKRVLTAGGYNHQWMSTSECDAALIELAGAAINTIATPFAPAAADAPTAEMDAPTFDALFGPQPSAESLIDVFMKNGAEAFKQAILQSTAALEDAALDHERDAADANRALLESETALAKERAAPRTERVVIRTHNSAGERITDSTLSDVPACDLLGLDASASFTFKATAAAVPATEYDFSGVLANGILKLLAVCDATQSHLWISGERGTGKTALVEALAKSTGRNFYRLAHSQQMECADYIGTRVFDDEGAMVWADGLLTTALRDPCAIIAIDEPSLNPAACQMYQTILDQRYLNIPATGERVNLQPDQLIIALDNTSGDGDQSGAYHGTAPVNIAFMDRFAFIAKASYMPMAAEAKLLERYCSAAQAHAIALYAQAVRSAVADGTVEQTVSYRRLEALAILIGSGVPQNTALVTAIFNHVNHADDEEFYRQLAGATLDLNN